MNGSIKYLRRSEINDAQWNACIENAGNGLIYGYSFYLDAMADAWDALVLNDYEAVMPLPWRKKWSINYLYQPFLTAQLGVFGNNLSADLLQQFLKAVPKKFLYWDISLNHRNVFTLPGFPLHLRSNYVLSLNKPYEVLHAAYRQNVKRNIKKATQYNCSVKTGIGLEEVIELAKAFTPDTNKYAPELKRFEGLYNLLLAQNKAVTLGVYSAKNELLASAVFLFSNRRAYYILVGNHPNGKTLGASHLLIDAFIKMHAEKDLLLDFEGSDFEKLAFFYSSFGATEEKYAAIKLNRLPWWSRWLK